MEGGAGVGVVSQLRRHLLDPVLPQGVDAGSDGGAAGGGVIHLAGAHQEDLAGVPARLHGGRGHFGPDGGDVFRNTHRNTSFLSKHLRGGARRPGAPLCI